MEGRRRPARLAQPVGRHLDLHRRRARQLHVDRWCGTRQRERGDRARSRCSLRPPRSRRRSATGSATALDRERASAAARRSSRGCGRPVRPVPGDRRARGAGRLVQPPHLRPADALCRPLRRRALRRRRLRGELHRRPRRSSTRSSPSTARPSALAIERRNRYIRADDRIPARHRRHVRLSRRHDQAPRPRGLRGHAQGRAPRRRDPRRAGAAGAARRLDRGARPRRCAR